MSFADLYTRVRAAEGRLFPDEVVRRLPLLPDGHPLVDEWRAREVSSSRLIRYLAGLSRPLTILEVGCGNGWLSARLAGIPAVQAFGMDINSIELAQAARVLGRAASTFLAADIFQAPFPAQAFDVIVLASVVQYFPDLPALVQVLRSLLKPTGEIHVLDSPLYEPGELLSARQRTRSYYERLGFPDMADHYFQHPTSALDAFSPRWLYRPKSLAALLSRMLGQASSPFPWVCLR